MVETVLREKVYVDQSLSTKEIMQRYGLCQATAYRAKKVGYFCKNYSTPQVKCQATIILPCPVASSENVTMDLNQK